MGRRSKLQQSLLAGLFLFLCLQFATVAQTAALDQTPATATPSPTPQPLKKYYFPNVSNLDSTTLPPPGTAPSYSTSVYMLSVDSTKNYNLGCQIGTIDRNFAGSRDTLVILDFGSPKMVNAEFGTDLFWMGPVTINQIKSAVQNFSRGYYICADTDRTSQIYVGVGTTNYFKNFTGSEFAHGVAWSQMVNELNSWLRLNGYASQVHAAGATDIELSWSTPGDARAWVDGFDSINLYDYYDYGTLDGCSYTDINWNTCVGSWTREDAWYKAFGPGPAFPIPEIYNTKGVNAKQWALLSLYSVIHHKVPIEFNGVMTQYQACTQAPVGQCYGIDNTPNAGWTQLYTELKKDSRTAFFPRWSTDIRWAYEQTADAAPVQDPSILSAAMMSSVRSQDRYLQTLAMPDLNPQMRDSLTEKLAIVQQVQADHIYGQAHLASKDPAQAPGAPVVSDPGFLEGIFSEAGGMAHAWEGTFNNHWQAQVGSDFVIVSAGATAEDAPQGQVMVVRVSSDRSQVSRKFFIAPAYVGSLTVSAVAGSQIMLSAENGELVIFDLETETFQ